MARESRQPWTQQRSVKNSQRLHGGWSLRSVGQGMSTMRVRYAPKPRRRAAAVRALEV